jgi:hypothetical protein
MPDDWTKTRVAGSTVGVIGLAILGLMCALIWGGIMMAPKNELRRSDYTALRVTAIIAVVSLGVSLWIAFVKIRNRFDDPEVRAAKFKQALLGLGGIAAAFALGAISYLLAAPGMLAFAPGGLAVVGMIAIIAAMQGSGE